MLIQFVLFFVSSNGLLNAFVALDISNFVLIWLRSCRINCTHVVFGLPFSLLNLHRYPSKTIFADFSGFIFILCPNNVNSLVFLNLIQGSHFALVYSSLLLMFLCHLIPKILFKRLYWKTSVLLKMLSKHDNKCASTIGKGLSASEYQYILRRSQRIF